MPSEIIQAIRVHYSEFSQVLIESAFLEYLQQTGVQNTVFFSKKLQQVKMKHWLKPVFFFLVTQLHSAIEAMPSYTFEELINKFWT